ncbi:MAG: hypothetical protein ABI925_13155, partial [Verrucomicrobiota bacterium]
DLDRCCHAAGGDPQLSRIHGPVLVPVTVNYSISGTAHSGSDFTLSGTPGQVTIPAGQSSATVTLHAIIDHLKESKETVIMTLTSGTGYTISLQKKATTAIGKNNT